ncbi:UvrD-helicase domain-containing protein [Halocalculus aciditolerans]|uniref:DNA 3'-5' helicase n=1 Tax=Halocalculus aciditolerans TaxID=1383812 RepID=A0A830FNM9_9EURY|nr:UvrD-helicase domain-containing protein [Halocalculus aciditolerans]GGL73294.1 hypothetical protein GCM10009039_34270 [Halocalculus aciditolerans]
MSDDGGPVRLRGAQAAIRDAFVAHESGLFTLNCVPGSGKSLVAHHVAAEDVLRRYVAGESSPAARVAVVSFNRDEAADIVPAVTARLRDIVEYDLTPAGREVSMAEADALAQRVRDAPFVGTVDSLLRDVFGQVAVDLGFDGRPDVGNDARLARVREACYESVRGDDALAARLDRLEAAYPDEEYEEGVAEMLASSLAYCRDRRLSTAAFRDELDATVEAVYPGGRPAGFADVVAALGAFAGEASASAARDRYDSSTRERVADADRSLYDSWTACVADFCAVFEAYRAAYREATRERGVVSHTDVAYLVDGYFAGTLDGVDAPDARVRARYRARIGSLVVDEAQDVSLAQHAALSHLVTPSTRVFACGDTLQSVYGWRHADPTVFERAARDGVYLGVEWGTHETRTARTTYRCAPAVAAAVDAVMEPVLSDAARGNAGPLDVDYPRLEAAREEPAGAGVHVAAFEGTGRPGSQSWVNPERGQGEATVLATYLARALADGTFTDEAGDPLDVTVLFRRRTRMADYEAAFAAEGLRVRRASDFLFDCPVVAAACAALAWLADPTERTLAALVGSPLPLGDLRGAFDAHGWDVDAVRENATLTAAQAAVLDGLCDLRERRAAFETQPVDAVVEDVAEALSLRADPHGVFAGVGGEQRVANVDALAEVLADWVGDEADAGVEEAVSLAAPYRETPREGPQQPNAGDAHDVTFRTVHRAKGDEDDVVVLADLGFDVWSRGPYDARFVARDGVAALAPPTNTDTPTETPLPPYAGGVYEPDGDRGSEGVARRDAGLRWATEHWRDVAGDAERGTLVGPPRLQSVAAAARAESWRLLYVALTRARDHLVVPLPKAVPGSPQPRDRWLDAVRDGLGYAGGTDDYTLDTASGPVRVGVNDVDFLASTPPRPAVPPSDVASVPPRRGALPAWLPRFVNPSTMYPLTEDPAAHAVDHLLGNALHTETEAVPESLPFPFDAMGPGAVGRCLHAVLTGVVARGVDEASLREMTSEVRSLFDEVVEEHAPDATDAERDALVAFFEASVRDAFLDSTLWAQLDAAASVAVEQPVDGLVRVAGVEFELHGQADFVIRSADGTRRVVDVKIALAEPTAATRRRYALQVAAYASLFEREGDTEVQPAIETFGVTRETVTSSLPAGVVERRLASLLDSVT